MSAIPFPPANYVQSGIESNIIELLVREDSKSFCKPTVVLSNQKGELNATGKTATASYICSTEQIKSYYSDGILYFSLGPLWNLTQSSLDSFYSVLMKEVSQLLCPKLMLLEARIDQPQSKQIWESKIHDMVSLGGASSRILLVLDGLEDLSLIAYIAHLGFGLLVTTRCDDVSENNNILVSRILPNGNSKFNGVGNLTMEVDNVISLTTLLTCACRIGSVDTTASNISYADTNHFHHISQGEMLLKNICSLSAEDKRMYLMMCALPAGVFLPALLVSFIWESAAEQLANEDPLFSIHAEQDAAQRWVDFRTTLASLSLLSTSTDDESVLIPLAAKQILYLLVPDQPHLYEEAESLLAFVLYDRELLISLDFENHVSALLLCFDSVKWSSQDIMSHFGVMFENELEKTKIMKRGRKAQFHKHDQFEVLFGLERMLSCLFNAFSGCGVETLVIFTDLGEDSSRQEVIKWAQMWMARFVELQYEWYEGQRPLELASSLELYARLSEACGYVEESVTARKGIVDIHRSCAGVDDEVTATALYSLAAAMFRAQCSGIHRDCVSHVHPSIHWSSRPSRFCPAC